LFTKRSQGHDVRIDVCQLNAVSKGGQVLNTARTALRVYGAFGASQLFCSHLLQHEDKSRASACDNCQLFTCISFDILDPLTSM
jgi:protein subunit release factor A